MLGCFSIPLSAVYGDPFVKGFDGSLDLFKGRPGQKIKVRHSMHVTSTQCAFCSLMLCSNWRWSQLLGGALGALPSKLMPWH